MTLHIIALLFLMTFANQIDACTAFSIFDGEKNMVGKNYDYIYEKGFMAVNKRNMRKQAACVVPIKNPARWTSHYGSVTFNQYGRDFPVGGMNEAGLVAEVLWIDDSQLPAFNEEGAPLLDEGQWIQYMLDQYGSVEEVVAHAHDIQIFTRGFSQLHYFLSDSSGNSAVIEYINGELVIHDSSKFDVYGITNSSYTQSMSYALSYDDSSYEDTSIHIGNSFQYNSLQRFVYLSDMLNYFRKATTKNTFNILNKVTQRKFTLWQIAYETDSRRIHFVNRKGDNSTTHIVKFATLDFSNKTPAMIMDLTGDITGEFTGEFVPYKREHNRRSLEIFNEILKQWLNLALPDEEVNYLTDYPDTAEKLPEGKESRQAA